MMQKGLVPRSNRSQCYLWGDLMLNLQLIRPASKSERKKSSTSFSETTLYKFAKENSDYSEYVSQHIATVTKKKYDISERFIFENKLQAGLFTNLSFDNVNPDSFAKPISLNGKHSDSVPNIVPEGEVALVSRMFMHQKQFSGSFHMHAKSRSNSALLDSSPLSRSSAASSVSPEMHSRSNSYSVRQSSDSYRLFEVMRLALKHGEKFCGYLMMKETGRLYSEEWRRRWCVLSGNVFAVFTNDEEVKCILVINFINDISNNVKPSKFCRYLSAKNEQKLYAFQIMVKGKPLVMQANDSFDLKEWCAQIQAQVAHFQSSPHTCEGETDQELLQKLKQMKFLPNNVGCIFASSHVTTAKSIDTLDGFDVYDILGKGSFGEVRLAHHPLYGECAIKMLQKPPVEDTKNFKIFRYEIECLERLHLSNSSHPNIIRLISVLESVTHVFLILEYADGQELLTILQENGPLNENLAQEYFMRVLDVIRYMHKRFVIHRDLKGENLKVTKSGGVKLLDYGFAKCLPISSDMKLRKEDFLRKHDTRSIYKEVDTVLYDETNERSVMDTYLGTRYACSPEVLSHQPYTAKVDCWGLGVLLYMMLVGKPPFKQFGGPAEQVSRIKKGLFAKPSPRWGSLSLSARDLIHRLLDPNPTLRPTPQEIFQHDWCSKSL